MLRNLLLMLLTAGALGGLFFGYLWLVQGGVPLTFQAGDEPAELAASNALPRQTRNPIPNLEVSSGGKLEFTVYDERTGQPTQSFRCRSYEYVAGSDRDVRVEEPQLTLRLPSGRIASISAKQGQLAVDRMRSTALRPKSGWLEGDARIEIRRNPDADVDEARAVLPDSAPADAPGSEDAPIVVELGRLEFDLVLGSLTTASTVALSTEAFDVSGTGLRLTWNQGENRLEELEIDHGGEIALYTGGDPADPNTGLDPAGLMSPAPAPAASAASQPAAPQALDRYVARLNGGVRIEQVRRLPAAAPGGGADASGAALPVEHVVGGIDAEAVELYFDVGSNAAELLGGESTPGRRRATRAAHTGRLLVRWGGQLLVSPTQEQSEPGRPRLRFMAEGPTVSLQLPDASVTCGKLHYHRDEDRLILDPAADGRVRVERGDVTLAANVVHYDGMQALLKLIGDVHLSSGARSPWLRPEFSIRCKHWAHLRMAENSTTLERAAAFTVDSLRSGRFVGSVDVRDGRRRLRANELEAEFSKPAAATSRPAKQTASDGALAAAAGAAEQNEAADGLSRRLRRATALGDVRLDADGRTLLAGWLAVDFEPSAAGQPAPGLVDARGVVRLRDEATGFRALGDRLSARLTGENQLALARVIGWSTRPAIVDVQRFSVRGAQIDLDALDPAQDLMSVKVAGRSELRFTAAALGAAGLGAGSAAQTSVTSQQLLQLSLTRHQDEVRFVGEVIARSGNEQLAADSVTLELGKTQAPAGRAAAPARGAEGLLDALGMHGLRYGVLAARGIAAGASLSVGSRPAGVAIAQLSQREPLRLLARNALFQSETFAPGDREPLVHQSITAPEMVSELQARLIRTIGETRLYMTNRRGGGDGANASSGDPSSAMLAGGPSGTILVCQRSMTYSIGPDDAQRRDRVLFEGGVRFRHLAGQELQDPQFFPRLQQDAGLLDRFTGRFSRVDCERLEGEFGVSAGSGAAQRANLQLQWLLATGNVFMRDQFTTAIRSIDAQQVEFNRQDGTIRVRGADSAMARVYNEDRASGRLDLPAIAEEIVLDLRTNTVRSTRIRGQFGG